MKLTSRPILGFLSDPLCQYPRALSLQAAGVAAHGGERSWIGFEEIAARPSTKRGMLSSSLALDLNGGVQVVLPAVNGAAASAFAEAIADAWSSSNLEELAKEEGAIRQLLRSLGALQASEQHPSACYVDPIAREAAELTARVVPPVTSQGGAVTRRSTAAGRSVGGRTTRRGRASPDV